MYKEVGFKFLIFLYSERSAGVRLKKRHLQPDSQHRVTRSDPGRLHARVPARARNPAGHSGRAAQIQPDAGSDRGPISADADH